MLEPRASTGRAAWTDGPALGLVLAAALAYGGVNHYRLAHYYPLEFDLAIFTQGLHALSRLETPFVTVRGMHLFGEPGSPWLLPREGQRWWRGLGVDAEERLEVSALLARIPAEATVSAHYRFLPHLARRPRLYMFPALGPRTPDAVLVDLDRAEADNVERPVLARLGASCREVARTARRTVLLACAAEGGEGMAPPRGGDSTSPPGRR